MLVITESIKIPRNSVNVVLKSTRYMSKKRKENCVVAVQAITEGKGSLSTNMLIDTVGVLDKEEAL